MDLQKKLIKNFIFYYLNKFYYFKYGMGNVFTSDQESISSLISGDQGTEKKEEVPSEGREKEEETSGGERGKQDDGECTSATVVDGRDTGERRDSEQQPIEDTKSEELQHDGCGCGCGCHKFESNREFWEFIERQQSIWDRYHRREKDKGKLNDDDKEINLFEIFMLPISPPVYKQKKRNKRKKMKKKWFKKNKKRIDYIYF